MREVVELVGDRTVRDAQFRALFEEHYTNMVRLAYRIVFAEDDAEEVVQEAFADLYRRWEAVLHPAGYLRSTVVNGARRLVRRRITRDELYRRVEAARGPASEHDYVLDMLLRVPERQRTALVLAYYGDFTRAEIADALGCSEGTAKSLVHRAVDRLRKELEHG